MMQSMDQRAKGEAMDGARGGSARRSDGWCERWISLKERWMLRAVDQLEGAVVQLEEAMDDASDGSKSNRRSDGWCERWIS
jgi:hypothetical protein